jgi:hypothetical protein
MHQLIQFVLPARECPPDGRQHLHCPAQHRLPAHQPAARSSMPRRDADRRRPGRPKPGWTTQHNDPLGTAPTAGSSHRRSEQVGGYVCACPGNSTTYRDPCPPGGPAPRGPRCRVSRLGRARPHSGPPTRHGDPTYLIAARCAIVLAEARADDNAADGPVPCAQAAGHAAVVSRSGWRSSHGA